MQVQPVIIDIMGIIVPLCRQLNSPDDRAPATICKLPMSAEAVPAFFVKGSSASAMALDVIHPKPKR
jgi:hypothetical protein